MRGAAKAPAKEPARERLEFYVKIDADREAVLAWSRRIFRVDHVEPEVAAGALAGALVAPFSLAGGDAEAVRGQFIGMVVPGGKRGRR